MTVTNTTRAVTAILMALTPAALLVSGARAGDVVTDGWFRDSGAPAAEATPDWFEWAAARAAAPRVAPATSPASHVVDGWFRPPAPVALRRPLGDGLARAREP